MLPKERPLETTVRHKNKVAIIDLHGEINALSEQGLREAYLEAEGEDAQAILLNFTNVDYINSTGIALIVGLLAEARKTHRRLLTCGLNDHYMDIFKITRLVDFMSIHPDEASALKEVES